jgi:hypothetical protein
MKLLLSLIAGSLLFACSESKGPVKASASTQAELVGEVHTVACGCALDAIGHCGEYIEVDGEFVELELPASAKLGSMPFCGKSDVKVKVKGLMEDGRYVAEAIALVE